MGADLAFTNPGGIRAGLDAGPITWGDLFAVQPFGNPLVRMTLTGAQVKALLGQQFAVNRVLQPSGLGWTYRVAGDGSRALVDAFLPDGTGISDVARYSVVVNAFLAEGGDGFTVLLAGTDRVGGPLDLDALEAYVAPRSGAPVLPPATERVTRVP
jgi:5'-nucleotidase